VAEGLPPQPPDALGSKGVGDGLRLREMVEVLVVEREREGEGEAEWGRE
jgi:hypothetical protein